MDDVLNISIFFNIMLYLQSMSDLRNVQHFIESSAFLMIYLDQTINLEQSRLLTNLNNI